MLSGSLQPLALHAGMGAGFAAILEAEGIRREQDGDNFGKYLKVIGKTCQSAIAIPAIFRICDLISQAAMKVFPFVGSTAARVLTYSNSIVFSSVAVLSPLVFEAIRGRYEGRSLSLIEKADLEKINFYDKLISYSVKVINLTHLIAMAIISGFSMPLALGVGLSVLTVLPVLIEQLS